MSNDKLIETDKSIEVLAKEMQREYNRNYYQKNKEKMQKSQKMYWINKAKERFEINANIR